MNVCKEIKTNIEINDFFFTEPAATTSTGIVPSPDFDCNILKYKEKDKRIFEKCEWIGNS